MKLCLKKIKKEGCGSAKRRMIKKEVPRLSIIIVTIKKQIETVKWLKSCPVPYELIISRKNGLSYARNWGARQAKAGLLVFFDDDLTLKPSIWTELMSLRQAEFKMLQGFYTPITRVFAIHTKDFWNVGGFDESITFSGEDADFYLRAIDFSLKFSIVSDKHIIHKEHKQRTENRRLAFAAILEHGRLLHKYNRRFSKFSDYFFEPLKKRNIRLFLVSCVWTSLRWASFIKAWMRS